MKRPLSILLVLTLLFAFFTCVPAAGAEDSDFLLLDCERLDGWYGVSDLTTKVSLSDEKTQGEHSIRLDYGRLLSADHGGNAYVDFAEGLDLSNYTGFTFDLYVGEDMTGKEGGMQVNFITERANLDGYNATVPLNDLAKGWHTLSGEFPATAAVAADWKDIRKMRFGYLNYKHMTKQYFLIDNFRLTGPKNAGQAAPQVKYLVEEEPEGTLFVVDGQKDALYNDFYSLRIDNYYNKADGSSPYDPGNTDFYGHVWYGWDDSYIYWYLEVHDKNINKLDPNRPLGTNGDEDYVEFWMDPDPSTQKHPTAAENIGDYDNQGDTKFLVYADSFCIWNSAGTWPKYWANEKNVVPFRTDDGYGVECRLRRRGEDENSFRFNIAIVNGQYEDETGPHDPYVAAIGPAWWLDYNNYLRVDFADYDFANPPTVKGTVTTEQDGITVDGVTVALHEVIDGTVAEQALQTTTVAEGAYQFEDVLPGNYAVKIAGTDQYDAVEVKVKVTGKNVTVPAITLGEVKEPEPPVDETVYGDVTGEGEIDSVDALAILQHNVGILLDEKYLKAADVYQDGSIDSTDALCVLQYIVGLEKELPIIPAQ